MTAISPLSGHFIGLFPDLASAGGVQESGRLIALTIQEIAAQRGWPIDLLSLNDAPGSHALAAGQETINFRGYDRGKIRFGLAALQSTRRAAGGQGLVVLAAHPNLAPVAAWMKRAAPGTKTIVVAHGIEVWSPLSSGRRRALETADLLVAPSRYTAEKIAAVQKIPAAKICRLPWPLNPNFLRFADSRDALVLPDSFPQGLVILTVGRWASSERYKGADELIRTLPALQKAFPGVHLVLVGGGNDLPRLRQMAAKYGVEQHIHFFEQLPREQIAACYSAADVFALPSTGEGFGFVFLEAMAFGKPVVGVAAGGVSDIIENEVDGLLLPSQNEQNLTDALARLLGDSSLRDSLGQRAARKVREKYSFEAFREKLTGFIDALTQGELPSAERAAAQ